jgi:hypothetical protein
MRRWEWNRILWELKDSKSFGVGRIGVSMYTGLLKLWRSP